LPGAAIAPGFRAGRLLLPFGLLAFLEVVMSKRKAKPQSLTIIVVNPLKKSESLPSWEDVVAYQRSACTENGNFSAQCWIVL
jgi:hypothetical protein